MSQFDPAEIVLQSTAKMFEYEKLSRQIEECDDIDILRDMARCWIKLYMKQQETMRTIGLEKQPLPKRKDDEG
tara:strand:- start:1214 stop:1432 length:219 start_codon:yes stop_codon:yes gene_type:complete